MQRRLSLWAVLVTVAVLALVAFIAADVSAYDALPVAVHVTAVNWYSGSELLTSAPGFTMHASQSVTLTLTCDSLCYDITGAAVTPPFHLLAFSVVYDPAQVVNVTVSAPTGAYSGPIGIAVT